MANDTKVEEQNVVIGFTNFDNYLPAKYVFEMDDRPDADQTLRGAVRIRKYPAPPPGLNGLFGATLQNDGGIGVVVTEGELLHTAEVRERDMRGVTVVSGDTEIILSHPVVSGLDFYLDGTAYDVRGHVVHVNIGYNSSRNSLILSKACYVVVRYSYKTTYQILRYYPSIYNNFEAYYMPDPEDYGQLIGFIRTPLGMEVASPILFAITPPESIEAEFELYRVESTGFAKDDGMWEKPTGWPGDGAYPNSGESLDPNGSFIEIARTHEIGYFSLLNNTSRGDLRRSSSGDTIPLDFSKELKMADSAGSRGASGTAYSVQQNNGATVSKALYQTQKVQNAEYFEKYRRLLNKAPKMRTVHYDVPIAKPYSSTSDINTAREVVRSLSALTIKDRRGEPYQENTNRITAITETLRTFRIPLTVKAPARPRIPESVLRNQSNANLVDYNTQAQRINTMLSIIWEGVDWASLRKRILASYDPNVYQITFDSSFPSTS